MKKIAINIVAMLSFVIFILMGTIIIKPDNTIATYNCNYRMLSLTTKIETVDEAKNPVTINGDSIFFKTIEDPLVMTSESGIVIAEAGDDYNFVTQNDHVILINDEPVYIMTGKFKLFGDTYVITNINGANIGTIEFNLFGTNGKLYDTSGAVIAQYNSAFLRKDYIVSIFEDNTLDIIAIQMMFASYASDRSGDMNAN